MNPKPNDGPILIVEDDVVDAMTVRRVLTELGALAPLRVVPDGEAALAAVRAGPRPRLVLLDLNTPRMSGLEFLEAASAELWRQKIPVVVVTTSSEERDRVGLRRSDRVAGGPPTPPPDVGGPVAIAEAPRSPVVGYIVKPMDYAGFVAALRAYEAYWTEP